VSPSRPGVARGAAAGSDRGDRERRREDQPPGIYRVSLAPAESAVTVAYLMQMPSIPHVPH
jgi:hypothetical protein